MTDSYRFGAAGGAAFVWGDVDPPATGGGASPAQNLDSDSTLQQILGISDTEDLPQYNLNSFSDIAVVP